MEATLTENMKTWFVNMVNEEINQETGTIANERAFEKGSTIAEAAMHEANMAEHENYIVFLKQLRDAVVAEYEKENA